MPAALKSVMHWLVYAGLVVFASGMMLLGKADAVLVERLRLQINDTVVPVLEVLSQPVDAFATGIERLQQWTSVTEENARLRAERDGMLRWQAIAQRLETENASLRQLLKVVPDPQEYYRSARVVADSTGAFAHSVLVNAGSGAGVKKGQVVLTAEGLVGRVIATSTRGSRVLLISDLNSRIPVFVGQTRVRAVLAGDNSERPRLIHVEPGVTAIAPGDLVVTSGIAGAFPPGLPVGMVDATDDGRIVIAPRVDRDQLEFVRIVDFGIDGIMDQTAVAPDDRASLHPGSHKPSVRADAR
jgi:rod shape-determining protein MreC